MHGQQNIKRTEMCSSVFFSSQSSDPALSQKIFVNFLGIYDYMDARAHVCLNNCVAVLEVHMRQRQKLERYQQSHRRNSQRESK